MLRLSRQARSICAVAVVAATVFGTSQAGAAAPAASADTLQQEIDEVLATTKGGVQISRNEIAWHGGRAIMSFTLPGEERARVSSPAAQKLQAQIAGLPATTREKPSAAPAADSCPTETFGNDWYCFYDGTSYTGRRLQWNAPHTWDVDFGDYGFINKTSSWSNRGELNVRVYSRTRAGDSNSCVEHRWTEPAHTRAASVGSMNNIADCFTAS
ncbi:hypothetical protein GCM10010329_47900 [Streptomyces spiroverticillatus]|uniref:Peptidase inhibitor family I36 protein n=1 Tax=Streptomyces finlayi TaxID=67296 RepID=A0A918X0Y1_9ACTN|nr:peptidase inhibitor family I36 protein [Streptomyces finlayi]GHA19380.1 hypothetical protein GCM10010329_47900 [Streptomyces spiroverticillatus]GHD02368.1 hypothetical protein GCM10010334_48850 [Streptomyces finlayi]